MRRKKTPNRKFLIIFFAIAVIFVIILISPKNQQDPTDYISHRMVNCSLNYNYTSGCYKNAASDFLQHFTLAQVIDVFEKNEARPDFFPRCHEVTHYLGREEYHKTGSIAEVYDQCSFACHGGCYHGAIEAYFDEKSFPVFSANNSVIGEEIRNVCGNSATYAKPRTYSECIHGIGHAMMFITDGELPQSLKLCDSLQLLTDRETCYGGVFMESSSSSTNIDHPGKFIKDDDPMYPCNSLEEQYLKTCYTYQSSHFSIITHYDWNRTIQLCLQVPENYKQWCFRTIGTNQVGFTQNLTIMKEDCDLIDNMQFENECVLGVVGSLGGRYVGDTQRMLKFCFIVNKENKNVCYEQIAREILSWSQNKQELAIHCKEMPPEYVQTCENIILGNGP